MLSYSLAFQEVVTKFMMDVSNARTLKEIDEQNAVVKGTAFRAFKAVVKHLTEEVDYFYFNGDDHPAKLAELKIQQRIYSSSVHALLFTDKAVQLIEAQIAKI